MNLEVDVRESKSYEDNWERPEDITAIGEERLHIRFQVTDDHYICYDAYLHKPDDTLLRSREGLEFFLPNTRRLTIVIKPPPAVEGLKELDYEVNACYEYTDSDGTTTMKSATATPKNERLVSIDFYGRFWIKMKFVIKEEEVAAVGGTVPVVEWWYRSLIAAVHTDVIIVGSDGIEVSTKMELLMGSSETFKKMFQPGTKEFRDKRLVIVDFCGAVLKAFVHFLVTHEIDDVLNTTCDLLKLADKYDVPALKSQSEKLLMSNVTYENARELFRLLIQVNSKLPEDFFVEAHKQH